MWLSLVVYSAISSIHSTLTGNILIIVEDFSATSIAKKEEEVSKEFTIEETAGSSEQTTDAFLTSYGHQQMSLTEAKRREREMEQVSKKERTKGKTAQETNNNTRQRFFFNLFSSGCLRFGVGKS